MDAKWIAGIVVVGICSFAFIVIKIAEIYKAIKELWSPAKRAVMMVKAGYHWLRVLPFWLRHKPDIDLISDPCLIVETDVPNAEKQATQYCTSFRIRFQSKTKKVDINLCNVVMTTTQGRGMETNKASLIFDSLKKKDSFALKPNTSREVFIPLKRVKYTSEPESDVIDLTKSYEWRIKGIQAKISPLSFRKLKSFEGEQNLT